MKPAHEYGTKIGELATKISKDYFENNDFWAALKEKYPYSADMQANLKNLAIALIKEASDGVYNQEVTQTNMNTLAQALTTEHGITAFEFEHSGLLKALQVYLTMSASQAQT